MRLESWLRDVPIDVIASFVLCGDVCDVLFFRQRVGSGKGFWPAQNLRTEKCSFPWEGRLTLGWFVTKWLLKLFRARERGSSTSPRLLETTARHKCTT